jgi:hypothetical protein
VKLLGGSSPSGVPTICVAILDTRNRGEDLADVHDALGSITDHRTGNEVKSGIGKKAGVADGVWCDKGLLGRHCYRPEPGLLMEHGAGTQAFHICGKDSLAYLPLKRVCSQTLCFQAPVLCSAPERVFLQTSYPHWLSLSGL